MEWRRRQIDGFAVKSINRPDPRGSWLNVRHLDLGQRSKNPLRSSSSPRTVQHGTALPLLINRSVYVGVYLLLVRTPAFD